MQWNGDITSQHVNTGDTVLHVVCAGGHVNLVEFLLTSYDDRKTELLNMYDDLPVNLLNFDGLTPLMLAANRGTLTELLSYLSHCYSIAWDRLQNHLYLSASVADPAMGGPAAPLH